MRSSEIAREGRGERRREERYSQRQENGRTGRKGGEASQALLKGIHADVSRFLNSERLELLVPGYETPAVRERQLRDRIQRLEQELLDCRPLTITLPKKEDGRGKGKGKKRARVPDGGGGGHSSSSREGGDDDYEDDGRQESEGSGYRLEVERLKAQVQEAEAVRLRDSHRHAAEKAELDLQIGKLGRQVKFVVGEEEAAVRELRRAKAELEDKDVSTAAELRSRRQECAHLQEQLQQAQWEAREGRTKGHERGREALGRGAEQSVVKELKRELQGKRLELVDARKDQAATAAEARELRRQLEECNREDNRSGGEEGGEEEEGARGGAGRRAALEEAEKEARRLRNELSEMQRKTRRLERDKQEMEALRKENGRLQSQLEDAARKLNLSEKSLQENSAEIARQSSLTEEKSAWDAVWGQIVGEERRLAGQRGGGAGLDPEIDLLPKTVTPIAAMRLLRSNQEKRGVLLSKFGELEGKCKEGLANLQRARQEARVEGSRRAALEETTTRLQSEAEQSALCTQGLRRQMAALQELLASYEQDPRQLQVSDGAWSKLNEALEAAKEETRALKAAAECSTPSAVHDKAKDRVRQLEAQLEEVEADRGKLAKLLNRAEQELAAYEHRTAQGDYDVTTTKVIHMGNNPTAVALRKKAGQSQAAELEQSLHANAVLQAKLEALQAGAGRAEAEAVAARVEGMDKDKVNQRLKEMFRDRIQFFREGVFLLTGWKVDMTTDREHPQLRLRSMYADGEEDALLFQWGADGLELMETPFATGLDRKIFTYLTTCNSIPAFLSNLTLELFDKQTFVGAP